MEPPFDPAIPLLSLYAKDLNSAHQSYTATLIFIAAQFTIAKLRRKHRYPSTDERIKTIWYIYPKDFKSAY